MPLIKQYSKGIFKFILNVLLVSHFNMYPWKWNLPLKAWKNIYKKKRAENFWRGILRLEKYSTKNTKAKIKEDEKETSEEIKEMGKREH